MGTFRSLDMLVETNDFYPCLELKSNEVCSIKDLQCYVCVCAHTREGIYVYILYIHNIYSTHTNLGM